MWAWLNPKNLIQILTLLKALWDGAKSLYSMINNYLRNRQHEKNIANYEEKLNASDDERHQAGAELLNGTKPK